MGMPPQCGDVLLEYATRPTGRLIAKIDGGVWSHVRCFLDERRVADLSEHGARILEVPHGLRGDVFRPLVPLLPEQQEDLRTFFATNTWRGYGYCALVEMGVWYTLARVGLVSLARVRLHSPGLVCSSYVSTAFASVGIDLRPDLDNRIEGPKHIAESPFLVCVHKGYET